jgi:hypothetical protein
MIQRLKETVEAKFGRRIAYQKDCKCLSDKVFEHTAQVLSPSTLRRFYGFLSTNSNPSRATLDILSIFCGYKGWDDFRDKNSAQSSSEPVFDLWLKAQSAANQLSSKNCKSLKSENPLGTSYTIAREFANERLETFLNSEFAATPFIGPGGYGKTTLLIKWYEEFVSNTRNESHIVLLIPAKHLESWVGKDIHLDDWILTQLDIADSGLFETLNTNPKLSPGKFILVIDALDEIETNIAKTERIFNAVQNLTTSLSGQWFKLIVSSRYSSWVQFANLANSLHQWFLADLDNILPQGSNMPLLNDKEIQNIIDLTLNSGNLPRLIIEEIPYDLLQILSYPYYLQLFIDTYTPTSIHLVTDRIDLITEFLKKQIFHSPLADEKTDILYAIVELSQNGCGSRQVKKNDVKNLFPIHLKSAGNYAAAYNQLLSFGIITEEVIQNEFGLHTTFIKISQRVIFRMLLMHKLIEKSQGLTCELFAKVEKQYAGTKILPHLLNLMFELAYKRKYVDALKPFFELDEKTLENVFEFPNIHYTLAKDDFMRRELIPYYSCNARARKLLFEKHIDLNTIANSSRLLYFNYIQNATSEKDTQIGKTLLYASSAYALDFTWVDQFAIDFPKEKPIDHVPPIISGLWFSCKFFVLYINKPCNYDTTHCLINDYTVGQKDKWKAIDCYNFELGLMVGLISTKQYLEIYNRLLPLLNNKSCEIMMPEEKALSIYFELARWHIEKNFDDKKIQELKQYMDDIPAWIRYQTLIMGHSLLAMYSFTSGHIEKSYDYFRKAIEISNIAGYTIYEAKLLYSLSKILVSIGEAERARECTTLIESLTERSNIQLGSL